MSFSRAKVQRFNEIQNCTPSPADYNVSLKSRVAGAVIPRTDRFLELQSPSQSDNASFISSNSIPTFRTPNPPRRAKPQSASTDRKTKPVELFQTTEDVEALKEKIVECNNKDLYIQELTEYVDEMKQQLSDFDSQIKCLKNEKVELQEMVENLGNTHEKVLQVLCAKHQSELENLLESVRDLNSKMNTMKNDYIKLKEENQKDLEELLQSIVRQEELNDTLTNSYKMSLDRKTKEVEMKENQIQQLEDDFFNLKKNQSQQLEELKNRHQLEVQDVEYEMLKAVTDMQKQLEKEKHGYNQYLTKVHDLKQTELDKLQEQFAVEKLELQGDCEAKIKQLTENYREANVLAEMQMKEKYNDIEISWKLKLDDAKQEAEAILKECQAIAEYNIIQSEVEKNKAVYELAELKEDLEALKKENAQIKTVHSNIEQQYKYLQLELSNVTAELNEKLTKELKAYNDLSEQAAKDKHTYEVTILKTHTTVEALKKRLMHSDRDVEQLKAELEATEISKLEFEGKCNQLADELDIVCGLCGDMEEQNDVALRTAEEKIIKLEQQLLEKVETYKQQAKEQASSLAYELTETRQNLKDTMEQLHSQQILNNEAQSLISISHEKIERLECVSVEYTVNITNLQIVVDNLQSELAANRNKEMVLNKSNEFLKDENKKLMTVIELMQTSEDDLVKQVEELKQKCKTYEEHETKTVVQESEIESVTELHDKYEKLEQKYNDIVYKMEMAEEENSKLRKKIAEQESLIGPFREHLEAYEMEYNALRNQKLDAEKEAKEMGLKYAQILGHQNQKQKIKHLMDLKMKNFELSENKKELENKVRMQSRTIEKLRKDLTAVAKSPKKLRQQQAEDKENVSSPNHTLNSSRIESPGGPLRERN